MNYLDEWTRKMAPYKELFLHAATRREITRQDPLAFAITYLSHHLISEETGNELTLSEFHNHLIEYAKEWINPLDPSNPQRDAFIAPRACGKSTWLFLILPMWAAAHGHCGFVAAFSDSATQAENHLMTFKRELDTNPLLRNDFPELCEPLTKHGRMQRIADSRSQIIQSNEFVFMARGADSAVAGMKVGKKRPDIIILDDIEKGESNYSPAQVQKRINTLQTVIFPLNSFARVVLVGTSVMTGSIIHQCVKAAKGESTEQWIQEEGFSCHYFPALITDEQGEQRSLWPQKWSMDWINQHKHTRSFSINMMNDPVAVEGVFWQPGSFKYGTLESYGRTVLSIDPAVTNKDSSDWTGISVVSKHPSEPKLYVRYATHVKMTPQDLRAKTIQLLNQFPDIVGILVETNQGGDLWHNIFGGLAVKYKTIHQKDSKETRATQALVHYERGKVFHTEKHILLEDEMLAFPRAAHDDVLDCVVTAINWFAARRSSTAGKALTWME